MAEEAGSVLDGGYFEYRGRSPFLQYGEIYLLTVDLDQEGLIDVKVRTGYSSRSKKRYSSKKDFERDWVYKPDYYE